MNRSLYQLPDKRNPTQLATNPWKIFWIAAPVVSAALILIFAGHEQRSLSHRFLRLPSSPVGRNPVLDEDRVDALDTKTSGLLSNTVRRELRHAAPRSTNPRADVCFGLITGPVLPEVPFGRTDSASTIRSRVVPSTDDGAQLMQTIPWRSKKCVSSF